MTEVDILAQRYKLQRPLGKGGMGSVWLAQRIDVGQMVAVKVLDPAIALDPVARERFEREARALASIKSRYVVALIDYGVQDNVPFQVMPVLEGEDLAARLKRVPYLSIGELAPIVDQIAKGLARVHATGLVHRDLKPANIFLAIEDDQEVAKVIDFGIAKAVGQKPGDAMTQTGDVIGTPLYMSPEQVRGAREIDQRSDVWSVGATIYRALTGRVPFLGDSTGDVMVRICTDTFTPARSLNSTLPPIVDEFFAKALAKDVAYRYATVVELADAFYRLAKASGADLPPMSKSPSSVDPAPSVPTPSSSASPSSGQISQPLSGGALAVTPISRQTGLLQRPIEEPLGQVVEPRRGTSFVVYLLFAAGLVGVLALGYFAMKNRRSSMAGTGAPGSIVYTASLTECIDPQAPDPDACGTRTGFVTVDFDMEETKGERDIYLRFDLDRQLDGKQIERATLRMTVPRMQRADSPHAGELWEVAPFERADLVGSVPPRVGVSAIVTNPGPATFGQVVTFNIPGYLLHYPGSVYLGLFPRSPDGADYYSTSGTAPPTLTVEYR